MRTFMKKLLGDLHAFERMLEEGRFETDVRRIGAEQELFIVDRSGRPAPVSLEVLSEIDDPHFTTELASFNLEFNLDPILFEGKCLSNLENEINRYTRLARDAAGKHGAEILLTGILPTLRKSDLSLQNMTECARYTALNEAMTRLRGKAYEIRIQGLDELRFKHYSVMLESCNTSFQVHFQVSSEDFARLYNIAQVVTAPVLAAASNSPLLFGKRLWKETRIALFQQSVDTRSTSPHLREVFPRVSFGSDWVQRSVAEVFQEDIARFKVLLSTEIDEDPFESLASGVTPRLQALQLRRVRWGRPARLDFRFEGEESRRSLRSKAGSNDIRCYCEVATPAVGA